jgi:glycosyltransferase involved in cell wall biosynthesis
MCPVLGSNTENDWSRRIWQRKNTSWKDLRLTVVAPSRWLADRARCSALFSKRRIEVIPNGINTALFCPGDKVSARRALGLPEGRKLILFGAKNALSDNNKGFDLLQRALAMIHAKLREETELVIFGEHVDSPLPDCVLPVTNLGEIHEEERIVLIYRAADIFVMPSRQENLPNMVMEAMSCGTPCVAFAIGGIPDLIDHGETGYLALPYVIDDMARGMVRLLEDEKMRAGMAAKSRQWALNTVSIDRIVERYATLYRELTGHG